MRRIVLPMLAGFFLSVPAYYVVRAVGKGETKVPVCHKGSVVVVGEPAVSAHLGHGDCRLDTGCLDCKNPPPPPSPGSPCGCP